MAQFNPCLAHGEGDHGDIFFPVCDRQRGHPGPHWTHRLTRAGEPFIQDIWHDAETIGEAA